MTASLLTLLLASPALAASTATYVLPEPADREAVLFEADHFDYDGSSGAMHLQGHVRVYDDTWTIHANELWLDMETRAGRAEGALRVEDKLNVVEGDGGAFNFATRVGTVHDARAAYAPWRVRGRSAWVDEQRHLHYTDARFTSCSENPLPGDEGAPPPDYHFRASRLRVKPKKYLIARNVRLYIKGVPVFYTPVLWKSLRPKHLLRTRFSPGYDRRNGPFVRTNTLYSFDPSWQGKLFVDYYGHSGLGVGNELQFLSSEEGRGGLYLYRIQDQRDSRQRWAGLGDYYHTVVTSVAVQGRLQAQSDPAFHNDFTRANAFRVTELLENSGAVVRATSRTTTRVSYARFDVGDSVRPTRFLRNSESAPRLDFFTAPMTLGLPVLSTFRAFADNNYDRTRGFQQKSTGGSWEVTQTLPIVRGVSLSPRAAFEERFTDREVVATSFGSSRTIVDAFTGRADLGGTLRFAHPFGDTDVTHAFRQRLKPDDFSLDAGAPDYGIEANLFSVAHGFRPSRRVYTRIESGFDFRRHREFDFGFRDRVQPFAGDFTFLLPAWDLTLHEDYQLQEGHRALLLQADYGDRDRQFLRLGLANVRPQERHFLLSQEVGWGPKGGSWQLSGALRTDLRTAGGARFDAIQVFEKELTLRKDFHDFHTFWSVRSRPGGVQEFQFRINLRVERADVWRRRVYTDYTGR
ncbi:MAG: LPS-assembly protein LptD [Elusimicrobia bacterium]|nr:LPS-assembly protein LptD [Elusimicrobiota bacterium]